jgi:hypothetical protein
MTPSTVKSNYGVTLYNDSTASTAPATIGEIVSIDPPEYMSPAVEATNHGSAGVREFVPGKLSEMGEFKATINYIDSDIAKLVTAMTAGTVGAYHIGLPSAGPGKLGFSALVTSIKPLSADATAPDTLKAEVTFRPSGTLSMSS